jgi:hypothetical protein
VSKSGSRRPPARERLAQQRALEAKRKRQRRWFAGIGGAVVVVVAAVVITIAVTSGGGSTAPVGGGSTPQLKLTALSTLGTLKSAPSAGPTGPEGVPVPPGAPALASASGSVTGQTTDGISCQTSEQTLFHIHAHLTIFINGQARAVLAAIGIPGPQAQNTPQGPFIASGTCFYWLHTHAADGVIHIESPVKRTYTLGNFFDEWNQPLSPSQVGPQKGHVTVLYNGKVYQGNPRDVPLNAHAQIQLEIGKPLVGPTSITWPKGL